MSTTPQVRVRQRGDRENLQLAWTDPLTGRIHTRSAGTDDWDAAQRAAALWETELRSQQDSTRLSWDAFRLRYEDEYLINQTENTRQSYSETLSKFESLIGNVRDINLINSSVLSRFGKLLRDSGLAESSVSLHLRQISAILGWAHVMGMIATKPVTMSKRVADPRGRPLKLYEVIRYLSALRSITGQHWPEFRKMIHAMWLGGLRFADVEKISYTNPPVQIDLDREFPAIKWHATGQKSKRVELVPIPPDFARFLHRERRDGLLVQLSLKRRTIQEYLTEAGRLSGIKVSETKWATAHDFRRTYGNRWALRVTPLVLKTMMRHKSIQTTEEFYLDIDTDDVAAIIWPRRCTRSSTRTAFQNTKTMESNAEKRWETECESTA